MVSEPIISAGGDLTHWLTEAMHWRVPVLPPVTGPKLPPIKPPVKPPTMPPIPQGIISSILGILPHPPTVNGTTPSTPSAASKPGDTYDPSTAHKELLLLIGQVFGVAFFAFVADNDRGARNVIVSVFVVLWIIWLMFNVTTFRQWSAKFGFGG